MLHSINRRQRGSALIISLIFLLLLSTLALGALRSSSTNVQIVGNMQARQEAASIAQMLIEQTISTDEFASNPDGVFAAARVEADLNGDGTSEAVAVLATAPVCLRARSVATRDLDPSDPADAPCFASASLANPGLVPAAGGAAGSLCADTEWHITAVATDTATSSSVTLHQGVAMRAPMVGLNVICN
jgi:Tfp pilus assembly protein PilX